MPINYDQSGVVYDSTVYTWDGEVRTSTVFPIVGVFVAFNDGPYTANPGWQEITPYVRAVSTHRGRSNDLEQFETGTAQLVLDNRDRRFDPFYTSGPYYTKLTPRRQIRIVGQIGGSNYDVFRGYIAGWPVTWSDAGKDSTVTIQCFDALGLMANETVPTDWPGYYTQQLAPRHYWKCNDSRTTAQVLDIPASGVSALTLKPTTTETFPFEVPPAADGLVGNGLNFYTCPMQYPPGFPANTSSATSDLSLMFWATFQSIAGASFQVQYIYFGSRINFVWNYTGAAFALTIGNATRQVVYTYTQPPQGVGLHYAIVVTANPGGDPSAILYENGAAKTPSTTTSSAGGVNGYEQMTVGTSQLQEMSAYTYLLSAAQVQQVYNAGIGRYSETTTARMNRLIATTDYPTLLTAFTASPAATVAEIGTGANVIPEMQLVADSEGGELYVNKSGILTTTNRTDVFTATRSAVSQATITDSGAGLKYGTELQIQWDADNLKNDVTVNYSGGGQVEVYNDATIAGYGAASTVIETQLADPTSANQLALMELGVEGSLIPQISPIDLSPNTAAADWQAILGLELLDRVTFKRTPTVGNQFNRDALINAIDHQIAPGVWNTQVTLSMRYTSPLTLDDDILGTLDYNYLG